MTLNSYEMVYIVKPDITEVDTLNLVNYYRDLIKHNGGRNVVIQHRGRKHLSYNIAHYYDGVYVQLNYSGNGVLVKKIEKSMRLDSKILRCLTVKV